MMNEMKVWILKKQLIGLFLIFIVFLFLQPSSVNAVDCRCSYGVIDQYYNAAIQQYNQGDYITAFINFHIWYDGVLPCQNNFEKGFWGHFQAQFGKLDNLVRTSFENGKHKVLSNYSQSGGGVSGKGDSGYGGGKVMPYFSPTIIRK